VSSSPLFPHNGSRVESLDLSILTREHSDYRQKLLVDSSIETATIFEVIFSTPRRDCLTVYRHRNGVEIAVGLKARVLILAKSPMRIFLRGVEFFSMDSQLGNSDLRRIKSRVEAEISVPRRNCHIGPKNSTAVSEKA
jgi:hypothetical protein